MLSDLLTWLVIFRYLGVHIWHHADMNRSNYFFAKSKNISTLRTFQTNARHNSGKRRILFTQKVIYETSLRKAIPLPYFH